MIFGTNTKIIRAQVGCLSSEQTKVRLQYHNTRLVEGVKGTLSDEFSLIGEWYPNDWLWMNCAIGYSIPGSALSASGLGNPFSWLNSDAVQVANNKSLDIVIAIGVTY